MKRLMSMILIISLLLPTSTLRLIAETTVPDEEGGQTVSPTAYFPFDGNLADQTDSQKTGTAWTRYEEGVSEWGEQSDYTFTYEENGVNQSVRFDGTTGIKLPDNLLTSDTYSVGFWLKQTGEISDYTSAFYAGMGLSRMGLSPAIGGKGEYIFQVGETDPLPASYHYQPLPELNHDEWNHFFIASDSGVTTVYVNGEAIGTMSGIPDLFTGRHNEFLLGFNPFPDAYYHGLMDELVFYDGTNVTESMIQSYYATTAPSFGHDSIEEPEETPEQPGDVTISNEDIPSLPEKQNVPTFTNVSVHDPSIIASDGYFYAFGTHGEAAKSTDLMNWETFTNGYQTPGNALYGDLSENLAEAFLWAGEDDADSAGGYAVWAPEAFFNKDYQWEDGTTGAYMIYYSASSTYIRSVIGYAVSKTIEGPYEHVDTLIYSGFTDKEAYDDKSEINKHVDGTNIPELIEQGVISGVRDGWFNSSGGYKNTLFTNAIDANLFYDADGNLWMTYGSWSGGIFMLEVDQTTGKVIHPGEDGTTADGRMIDRYFGTKISGGYTKSGEGPYVEYNANDGYYYLYVTYGWLGADGAYHMRQFRSENPTGPYVDKAGEPAVLPVGVGNAAYGNKLTGNFLFTRETGETGEGTGYGYVSPGHNSIYTDQATNQQFNVFHTRFPNRGEQHELRVHQLFNNEDSWRVMAPLRYAGEVLDTSISVEEIVGTYKYLNHGKNNAVEIVESTLIELHDDYTVTGTLTGTWSLDGAYLTIDTQELTAKGVVLTQWDETSAQWLTTFTALSENGESLWGIMHPASALTDEESVTETLLALDLPRETISNVTLPTTGTKGAMITWASSNAAVISSDGTVTRPVIGEADTVVTLEATVTLNDVVKTKTFDIVVRSLKQPTLQAHFSFDGHLDDETGQFDAAIVTDDTPHDDETNEGSISFEAGQKNEAAYFDGQSGLVLPEGLLTDNHYSISFWFNPEVTTNFTPSLFVMRDADHWFTVNPKGWNDEILVWSRVTTPTEKWFDGITNEVATPGEWRHVVLTNEYGKGHIYIDGKKKTSFNNFNSVVNGEALTIYLGVNPFDSAFKGWMDELVIYQSYTVSDQDVKDLYQGEVPEVSTTLPDVTPSAHFSFNDHLQDSYGNFTSVTPTKERLDQPGETATFVEAGEGRALYFDGDSGVNLGKGLITEKEYTVSFWLKPETLVDFTSAFFAADTAERWLSFLPGGSHGNGKTKLWSGTTWYDAELDFMIPVNAWSQVTFTVSFGHVQIYIDGEKVYEGNDFPDVFQTNEATFGLGVNYWDSPYKGYIDDVIIYNGQALDDEAISDYYDTTHPLIKAGPEFDEVVVGSGDEDESEGNPDSEDEDDSDEMTPVLVDAVAGFDRVISDDETAVYQLDLPNGKVTFTETLVTELDDSGHIELTSEQLTVSIPVSALKNHGQVTLTMEDITDSLSAMIDQDAYHVISRFTRFVLSGMIKRLTLVKKGLH
ncbi:LamG-like jellyroll fold domain-containing protein [Halolactibacillus sp. JCM 19043]|uniref:LamG-like jellyroll fold domain-containing protein n=1 Tax=Halolactibacillus sp. JCM 19043 TaxID=1460638 RepID=UPI0007839396|nr:LamG-like jellyroll fold domain-containing protein [Halolactibacillus sp. JCM 19043]